MRYSASRFVGLCLACVALIACGSDGGVGPSADASPIGTYTLQSVDGQSLPVVLPASPGNGGYRVVQAGHVILDEDGTWVRYTTEAFGDRPDDFMESWSHGTYEITDDTLTCDGTHGSTIGMGPCGLSDDQLVMYLIPYGPSAPGDWERWTYRKLDD